LEDIGCIEPEAGEDPLELLHRCGGLYMCPKASDGKRLGPLVGYAGRYKPDNLQFVGDIYANFAMAEMHPLVMQCYAMSLVEMFPADLRIDCFCAMPMGGITFAVHLGLTECKQVIFLEKKVVALKTETEREKSVLVAVRHEIKAGVRYALVEDVTNNFSTTLTAIELIRNAKGVVAAIVSILNRSPGHQGRYRVPDKDPAKDVDLPIISVVSQPFPEWKQDDPAVAQDIAAGNVVHKPKDGWPVLMKAMEDAKALSHEPETVQSRCV